MELVTDDVKKKIEKDNAIVDLECISTLRYLKIENEDFLAVTCPSADGNDIYVIAIPHVCVKKFKKEELMDGESGVRSTRFQETAQSEEASSDGEQEGN